MPCLKRPFTQHAAKLALKQVAVNKRNKRRKECRAYYCQGCDAWHLTSKEEWGNVKEVNVIEIERWTKLVNHNE